MLKILTDQQLNTLLAAPDLRTLQGRRDQALLAVLIYGGLRIAEACNLRRENLEYVGDTMRLTFAGKGRKVRTVTLPAKGAIIIRSWLRKSDSDYLFPGKGGAKALSTRTGHWIVRTNSEKGRLPTWIHPHSLRHTFGSKTIRGTGDLFLTSRVMGHANVSTTAKFYLAFDPTYADRAAEIW